MRFILEVIDGAAAGKAVSIQPNEPCRVGRAEGADLVIANDGLLSRSHFVVECDDSSCRVRDLNSTNGTFVNSQRITEAEVGEGDTVFAGRTTFAVRAAEAEAAPPAGQPAVSSEAAAAGNNAGISTVLAMKPYNAPDPPPESSKE